MYAQMPNCERSRDTEIRDEDFSQDVVSPLYKFEELNIRILASEIEQFSEIFPHLPRHQATTAISVLFEIPPVIQDDTEWVAVFTFDTNVENELDRIRILSFQELDTMLCFLNGDSEAVAMGEWTDSLHKRGFSLRVEKVQEKLEPSKRHLYFLILASMEFDASSFELTLRRLGRYAHLDAHKRKERSPLPERSTTTCIDDDLNVSLTILDTNQCENGQTNINASITILNCSDYVGNDVDLEIYENDVFANDLMCSWHYTVGVCDNQDRFIRNVSCTRDISEYEWVSPAQVYAWSSLDRNWPWTNLECQTGDVDISLEFIPGTPGGADVSDGDFCNRVEIDWNADFDADYYEVRRNGSVIGEPTASYFEDHEADPFVTYNYCIKACNDCGCSSSSDCDSGWRRGSPDNPSSVDASNDECDEVYIDWPSVSGAEYYRVERNGNQIGGDITNTYFSDTAVSPGQTYTYKVKSCNYQCGCSSGRTDSGTSLDEPEPASNPSPADELLNVPTNIDLSWNAAANTTAYKVHFGTSNPPIYKTTVSNNWWDPGSLNLGTVYYWRIDAVNDCGTRTGPTWGFITAGACGDGACDDNENCDSCPQDCGECCGNGSCDYGESCNSCSQDCGDCCGNGSCEPQYGETCASCEEDCGPCECDYDGVCEGNENCNNCEDDCGECCGNGSCDDGDPCTDDLCVDDECQNLLNYRCGDGVCDPQCENCASCPEECCDPLAKPQNVQATDGSSASAVEVTWSAVDGATEYRVYRFPNATNISSWSRRSNWQSGRSWSDPGATPGRTYWYRVKARNVSGESEFSEPDEGHRANDPDLCESDTECGVGEGCNVSAGTCGELPGVPQNVRASNGDRVWITWDNVPNADTYRVYSCSSSTNTNSCTPLGTTWNTSRSYNDENADGCAWYRVRSRNEYGLGDYSAADEGCPPPGTYRLRLVEDYPEPTGRKPPRETEYGDGAMAIIAVPTPDDNKFHFDSWDGDDVPAGHDKDNPLRIIMDGDKSITAIFQEVDCVIDADCPEDGAFCNGREVCVAGECMHSGSPCATNESCNEDEDCCYEPVVPGMCGAGTACSPDAPTCGIILLGLLGMRFVQSHKRC